MSKETVEIRIVSPLYSLMPLADYQMIAEAISYEASYWEPTAAGPRREIFYNREIFVRKSQGTVMVYTGHLDRIWDHCEEKGWDLLITGEEPIVKPSEGLPLGLKLKDYQETALDRILLYQRGVLVAPTGSGKTEISFAAIHKLPKPALFLAHTVDIVQQTARRARKFFGEVDQIGGGQKFSGTLGRGITFSTVQSISKVPAKQLADHFNSVFVDECHRVSSFKNTYAKILSTLQCSVRIGMTGSCPAAWEAVLAMEAFLGPTIHEVEFNEVVEDRMIVVPKIKIAKCSFQPRVRSKRDYQEVYDVAISNNVERNRDIARRVKELTENDMTVLVLVLRIEHGLNVEGACQEEGIRAEFVRGSTSAQDREEIQNKLQNREVQCAICTSVWEEGIDVPSLNALIYAGAGKSERRTLQIIGRTLRASEGKEEALVIDYFDPCHRYFVDHFGERVSLYTEMGWL